MFPGTLFQKERTIPVRGGVTVEDIHTCDGRLTAAVPWQIVDKTIMEADTDRDGKISFEEFTKMVESTDVSMSMTLGRLLSFYTACFGPLSCLAYNLHP